MEKIVSNGDRDCTVILDGTECSVKFDRCFRAVSVQNNSASDVFVSIHQGANAGDDGVMRIKSGASACYPHMRTDVDTVYLNGTGEIQVHGQNDTNNSFRNAPVSGGGGNSYTKSESDAKYAQKTDIPSSLPANGGNAATVGGVGIANLRQITQTVINTLPAVPNGEADFLVNCDTSDTSFPYWYGHLSIRYGSYTGEYVAIFRTTGNDNKVYYNTYLTNHWSGWQEIYTSYNKPYVTGTFTVNTSDTEQTISVPLTFNPSVVLLFTRQITLVVPKQIILIALSGTEYKIKIGVPNSGDLSALSTGFEAIINSWKGTASTIEYIAYK